MKRVLLLFIPLLVGLTSCDGEMEEIIYPVYFQDISGNESASMLMDVPGIEILAKSVLIENGLIEDYSGYASWDFPDLAMVVNKKDMLKDVVVPSNIPGVEDRRYQWPEIDFEKYSLVIGHFYTVNLGYCVSRQYIVKHTLYFEVGYKYEGGFVYTIGSNNYFAALYPKLPDGNLEAKRLNKLGQCK